MVSINGQIALVTGASSGIGAACARAFAAAGCHLILAARRSERVHALATGLHNEFGIETLALTLDVTRYAQVCSVLGSLPERWAPVDILLNNAGLSRGLNKLQDGDIQDWEEMIDTNLKGLLYVTRTILPGMIERGHGHVINIGSIAGHDVYPAGNVYNATKFGVYALTRGLRMDVLGTGIRVSSVDPGMVNTEFSLVRFHGDEARAAKVYEGFQPLTAEDVAEAVVFCATRPPHVDVQDLVLMPADQASAGMVHRK
jgi:3-hydroxy acid dehydrogenase / malonic semialdehyde reductase